MKNYFTVGASTIVLSVTMAGCVLDETPVTPPAASDGEIVLEVQSLPQAKPFGTRAPIEEWNNSQVSVFYKYGDFATPDPLEDPLVVTIGDNNTTTIKSGLYYPTDGTDVHMCAYYPPLTVDDNNIDLSKGDVDLLYARWAPVPEGTKLHELHFEHLLARFTFLLRRAENDPLEEPFYGIAISGAEDPTYSWLQPKLLIPYALNFDLDIDTDNPAANRDFWITPSQSSDWANFIFAGDKDHPLNIPDHTEEFLPIDIMVVPNRPLAFDGVLVIPDPDAGILWEELSPITLKNSPNGDMPGFEQTSLWHQLTNYNPTGGGAVAGKHYTFKLELKGNNLLVQDISVTPWRVGVNDLGDNAGNIW